MTLENALSLYKTYRPSLSKESHRQLAIACNLLRRYTGCNRIDDLSEQTIVELVNRLILFGRSPRTVNGRVANLLTLWRFCHRRKLVRNKPIEPEPLPEPRRIPRAWKPREMARLLAACEQAPTRRSWTAKHWKALVLVIYDTSLRVGCLLRIPRSSLNGDLLTVPAEEQKGRVETIQRLHPETVQAIAEVPLSDSGLLFDWPYHVNDLWFRFRSDVLAPAGLPHGRRDLFHKIRRTSYTQVYARIDGHAATEHAAHSCDLSKVYLDPVLLSEIQHRPSVVDVLPRPTVSMDANAEASLTRAEVESAIALLRKIADRAIG